MHQNLILCKIGVAVKCSFNNVKPKLHILKVSRAQCNNIQLFDSLIKLTRYVSKQKENIFANDQGLGTYVLTFRFYTRQTVDGTNKSTSNEAIMKENNQVEGNASIIPKECL